MKSSNFYRDLYREFPTLTNKINAITIKFLLIRKYL